MSNIKCIVSYNGTNFSGWQVQNDKRSVEGEIELALFKICKEEISIIGSGRTDKGVHSYGQTFNFKSNIEMKEEQWLKALNTNLPYDIRITNVEFVDDNFHSRFSCKGKTYQYILNQGDFDPIYKDIVYQYGKKLDIDKMIHAANMFIGKHDFQYFCSNSIDEVKDFVKEIYSFNIKEENNLIYFSVAGSGFLRYQVRMMVGTLIEIGANRKDETIISERLDKKGATTTSFNAPSNGLYLLKVEY